MKDTITNTDKALDQSVENIDTNTNINSVDASDDSETLTEFLSGNGKRIVIGAYANAHLDAHPGIKKHLVEAGAKLIIGIKQKVIAAEIDMNRIVGASGGIYVNEDYPEDAKLSFAKRIGRTIWTRVEQAPEDHNSDCSSIVIIVRSSGDHYELITAYIGKLMGKEPTDPSIKNSYDLDDALERWKNFALIHDSKTFGEIRQMTWEQAIANAEVI